jgi:hypothetical protein
MITSIAELVARLVPGAADVATATLVPVVTSGTGDMVREAIRLAGPL